MTAAPERFDLEKEAFLLAHKRTGDCEELMRLVSSFGRRCAMEALERAALTIPVNWFDPLLSGDNTKVIWQSRQSEIEQLLIALQIRIRALKSDYEEKGNG